MTAAAATEARTARHGDALAGAHVSFGRVLRSEWIKFTSLRSTAWTMSITVLVMVGFALLSVWGITQILSNPEMAAGPGGEPLVPGENESAFMATMIASSYVMAQIVVAVWGVLVVSGEYSTGQIRSTLAAVPKRLPVLAAKGVLVALTSFVVGTLGTVLSVLAVTPMLNSNDLALDLGDSETLRILLGAPLYLAAIALLALGFGSLLRHSAGGIASVLGLLIVLPALSAIPLDWVGDIAPYFPGAAGERIVAENNPDAVLGPWQGFGVLGIYVAVILAAAAVLLRRRDA
ncbi:ABC transporter permease [Ruania suaedae]|uniref:ABC transporter permease n=1 Tax=Ruania suaedae TaxID=2897774 RepID=UPI001E3801B1|nr:ABC transporter permease [Ruania suaedae]UFU02335.1 ABC transporter permease [Ruania suaedae]